MNTPLIIHTYKGLYCPIGDFYIDPRVAVSRALITHAHADHARNGSDYYLTVTPGKNILHSRIGQNANISTLNYGEKITINGVEISFHPAGHILGSAQIRLAYHGEVWVVSGDYKLEPDATCAAFESVPCHVFISEATFGIPIFFWKPQQEVFTEINAWWRENQNTGKTSVLLGYSLGKAQRLLAGLDPNIGPIYTHGAVEKLTEIYRKEGVQLPPTQPVGRLKKNAWHQGIILAPPSAVQTAWIKRFGERSTGFASGWMQTKHAKTKRNLDAGFVLSDHADWPGLLQAIKDSGAEKVYIMHGMGKPLVSYLQKQGMDIGFMAV